MFDTPDLGPLCIAPFVALLAAIAVYSIGSATGLIINKRAGVNRVLWHPIVAWLTVGIIPVACFASVALNIGARSPAPWFRPTVNNVIGAWELTAHDVDYLHNWHNTPVLPHELVFNKDGTFYVTNVPSFWGRFDPVERKWKAEYLSGSGTWSLGQFEGTERLEWIVLAQFQEIDGYSDNRLVRFLFEGHLPPYTLVTLDADLLFRFRKK